MLTWCLETVETCVIHCPRSIECFEGNSEFRRFVAHGIESKFYLQQGILKSIHMRGLQKDHGKYTLWGEKTIHFKKLGTKVNFFKRQRYRENFAPQVCSLHTCKSHNSANLMPGADGSVQISHLGANSGTAIVTSRALHIWSQQPEQDSNQAFFVWGVGNPNTMPKACPSCLF